eukprot:PhF_6_TR20547/c0_g1_i1/m.29673
MRCRYLILSFLGVLVVVGMIGVVSLVYVVQQTGQLSPTSARHGAEQYFTTTLIPKFDTTKFDTIASPHSFLPTESIETTQDFPSTIENTNGKFTIAILTYKAPKSLQHTLRSLQRYGLLAHPNLQEVIVYFQAFNKQGDELVVKEVLQGVVPFRVIGSAENMPVAKATFILIRSVQSPYVLYLECDRPIISRNNDAEYTARVVHQRIDQGLDLLIKGVANLVRFQLYASPDLVDKELPPETYGRYPTMKGCSAAPHLTDKECLTAKKTKGHTYHTAYCKHWKKFNSSHKFVDMCDSFCFMEWASQPDVPRTKPKHRLIRNTSTRTDQFVCLPSYLCNWTNQPTMYSVEWYKKAVIAPCEKHSHSDRQGCLGPPGRGSAVRQEIFLSQHVRWGAMNYTICVSRGLFYHYEIDNREASAPKF